MSYVNTLIYKRTHEGDPSELGIFGCHDCMGKIRGYDFDSVIGVGGKKPDKGYENIAFKINWVGLNPEKIGDHKRGPLLSFKHFCFYGDEGADLKTLAPEIFKYMFENQNVRYVMSKSLPDDVQEEVKNILKRAEKCPKSRGGLSAEESQGKCK